jgi:hypothetical protein
VSTKKVVDTSKINPQEGQEGRSGRLHSLSEFAPLSVDQNGDMATHYGGYQEAWKRLPFVLYARNRFSLLQLLYHKCWLPKTTDFPISVAQLTTAWQSTIRTHQDCGPDKVEHLSERD